MARMRFVVDGDKTEPIIAEGSTMDLLAMISMLIGDIYKAMRKANPISAEAFKLMLAQLVGDLKSQVWDNKHKDGEIIIASCTEEKK